MSGVTKSDAMIQHEKWISWVVEHNPKSLPGTDKKVNLLPEVHILMVALAVIVILVGVAASIHL